MFNEEVVGVLADEDDDDDKADGENGESSSVSGILNIWIVPLSLLTPTRRSSGEKARS